MSYHQDDDQLRAVPDVIPRVFRIQTHDGSAWTDAARIEDNHQRLVRVGLKATCRGVRFILDETWGAGEGRVYGFYVE